MKEIPIACSLERGTQESRGDEWRDLLEPNLVEKAFIPGGVRFVPASSSPYVNSSSDETRQSVTYPAR